MDNRNRPRARQKTHSNDGKGAYRRGSGLGTGPVGGGSYSGGSSSGRGIKRAAAGGGSGLLVIIAIVIMLFFNKGRNPADSDYGYSGGYNDSYNSGYSASGGSVDTSVANGSRDKYTKLLGNNSDAVTIMIYVCGTDLESKHSMASADMEEIRAASKNFGDNFNVIVYTGGCNNWKNGVSSSVNQIYQITDGKIKCLSENKGRASMTDPNTLSSFISYCAKQFPANRNELILWDHGGGSVSGFGYDEKNKSSGSMSLAGIDKALAKSRVKFDFIGFDACLMATAENALMLNEHADYLIASEETEPGIGWYYTNWLSRFAADTSMPTIQIGKLIIDDFVGECARKCSGQKTTLSIIDLAEFSHTVPDALVNFSNSVSTMITADDYKQVSNARYNTREFAQSSKIDQVDLVHLAQNMGNSEGVQLANAVKSAVKYNLTSTNMTNAYGVSIFFPYKRTSYVDKACTTYQQIGMDSEYSECIRKFAQLETSGQVAAGGSSAASPVNSLFGLMSGTSSGSSGSAEIIGQLLSGFLSSNRNIDGLDSTNTDFMKDQDNAQTASYLSANYFDPTNLVWTKSGSDYVISLPETQWELVHALDRNVFYHDGSGWIDLGLDNTFSFDNSGNLIADTAKDWISIGGQPVAYYHTDSTDTTDMGYVPAMLNGERVNLILVFEGTNAYIAGASTDYGTDVDVIAKNLTELKDGDKLDFLCDYYSDDMKYQDSYFIGEQMTYNSSMKITNTDLGSGNIKIIYKFTDIYNQAYWSEAITE